MSGKSMAHELFAHKHNKQRILIVQEQDFMSNTLEIEGQLYEERPQEEGPKMPRGLSKFVMAAMMLGGMSGMGMGGGHSRPFPKCNLEEEFKLIQQKKSKLSRADRNMVERAFHNKYRIYQPPITNS